MHRLKASLRAIAVIGMLASSAAFSQPSAPTGPTPTVVASFEHDRPTAAVMTNEGRLFVSLPYSDFSPAEDKATVVEILPDGSVRPYPDQAWNDKASTRSPAEHFLNVQSLTFDSQGYLWALDTGNPKRAGIVPGGAKVVKIDVATDRVVTTVSLGPALRHANSYPNDLRIDAVRQVAYVTDSVRGGIIVVDLASGTSRMTLAKPLPPAMTEEKRRPPVIEGVRIAAADGSPLALATDGIALDATGETLYFTARPLAGSQRLFRIATSALRDTTLDETERGKMLVDAGPAPVTDGIALGPDGAIYFSDLERNAISRAIPGEAPEIIVASPMLSWPDGIAFAPDGSLLITVAQFHLLPALNAGRDRSTPPYLILSAWARTAP